MYNDVKKVSIPWVTAHVVKLRIFSPTIIIYIYIYKYNNSEVKWHRLILMADSERMG